MEDAGRMRGNCRNSSAGATKDHSARVLWVRRKTCKRFLRELSQHSCAQVMLSRGKITWLMCSGPFHFSLALFIVQLVDFELPYQGSMYH